MKDMTHCLDLIILKQNCEANLLNYIFLFLLSNSWEEQKASIKTWLQFINCM